MRWRRRDQVWFVRLFWGGIALGAVVDLVMAVRQAITG